MTNSNDEISARSDEGSYGKRSDFVGRHREIEDLRRGLEDALSGAGRLYLIAGEPGIGKTRLADELAHKASSRGVQAIWGRCWEGGGATAYWPWRQIVRTCLRAGNGSKLLAEMGSCAHDLTYVAPEARDHIPAGREIAPLPSDPEQARFRLFDSVSTFLNLVSTNHPLLILLEDLHAADLSSLLLLRFVARGLSDSGILMVGTYRDAELRQLKAQADLLGLLASDSHRISLRGLTEEEVRELLKIDDGPVDPKTVAAIHRATNGNPLFVNEILRLAVTSGFIERDVPFDRILIPNGVRAAIHRHLTPLSDSAKHALTRASVIGREFEIPVLQGVAELSSEQLIEAVAEAENARLIDQLPDKPGRWRFSHALIRDALYEDVPAQSLSHLHFRIGETLEAVHQIDSDIHLSEIAYHFLQGVSPDRDPSKAIVYAHRAAQHAAETLAYEEAEKLYQLALNTAIPRSASSDALRCELLIGLAEAQYRAGMFSAARDSFKAAAELAQKINAPQMLSKAALGIGIMFGDAHNVDTEAVGLLNRALAALPNEDSILKAQLLAHLAVKLYLSHDFKYRSQLIDQAIAIARRLHDQDCLLFVLNSKRRALWEPENIDDRLATITEALKLAEDSGNREAALNALRLQIIDLGEMGDLDKGKARISTFVHKAEELRQPYHLWEAATLTASQALFEGRYEEGERLANEAFRLGQGLGFLDPGYVFAAQLAVICRDKGRLSEVANGFSEYAAQNPGIPVFRCTATYINAELGRKVEVQTDFSYLTGPGFESLPRRGVDWPVVLMLLSEICCYLGDKAQASRLYELLLPFAERNLTSFHIVSFGSAGTSLGKLAMLLGRFDDAVRHFEYALHFNERTGARPWLADAQYEYARMLLLRNSDGDISHALQLLDLSFATAKTIESVRLVSKIEALRLSHSLNEAAESTPDDWEAGRTASIPLKQGASDLEVAYGTGVTESRVSADTEGSRTEVRSDTVPEFQLSREGDYWTSTFRKASVHLKHSKGLTYIQTLLSNPGREIYAVSLLGMGDPSQEPIQIRGQDSASAVHHIGDEVGELRVVTDLGDAGEMLDSTAKKAYRRRLADLNEKLVKCKEIGNVDRATQLEDEIEQISRELRQAVGLMGRDRVAASAPERARVNVTRAIKTALDRIAEHDAEAGRFLSRAIRTGTFCCYLPHRDSSVN